MSKSQIPGERVRILADQFLAVPTTSYQQRSLGAALFMFLDTATKTALHRAELVSKSALSRLLNEYSWDTEACWTLLEQAQWDCLRLAAKGRHRPLLRLSVDLTSVEKKGSTLPFVRVYNEVHGIHLVVLFAQYRDVKFPMAYRVYKGKSTPTPTTLAREMLRTVPHSIRSRFRIRVLADSGFEAAVFLDEVRQLGFEFVVGVRTTRRTLHPGEVTVSDCPHGGYVELKNWPYETLTLGRFDRGDRTFHAVSSELMEGDEVIAEGKERWNEESFFKEGKHQFGLAQFALRTAVGLDRWILLVFLAWTLAILHRQDGLTLEECAFLALVTVLPHLHLNRLLHLFSKNAEFLHQHGYSLRYARCNS
ncbi:transposase [Deinococcus saxicola]|uniref:transposase n=1 Tax=Deinococcus saxicola TaxID=249406 RepID=UPI0039F074A9